MNDLNYGYLQPLSANGYENKTNKACDSEICKNELEKYLKNFQEYMLTLSVYDMASLLIAEQDWLKRYNKNKNFSEDLIGKILKVDFGKTYLCENGLIHYALCLSEYNGKYCVIPMTTSSDEIKTAYHPEFRPLGEKRLYLLKKSDGNTKDAALYINDMKFISSGRIITIGTKIKKSAYDNIMNIACEISMNQIYQKLIIKETEIKNLTETVKSLNEKYNDLKENYSILKRNNELLEKMLKNINENS